MNLHHLHIRGLSNYTSVSKLQEYLVRSHLNFKASRSGHDRPPPYLVTAQFHPVYTCGRREIGTVTPEQQEFLQAEGRASFHEALRGGQTTFHGPGQLVAYPIVDLKRHGLSAKCYVHMLEEVTIETCQHYGIATHRTSNPGVWVDELRKICAVGVHLRRNISSHGIGLNVSTDLWWFNRIVACGLEGKKATSMDAMGVHDVTWDAAALIFADSLAQKLHGVDDICKTDYEEVSLASIYQEQDQGV